MTSPAYRAVVQWAKFWEKKTTVLWVLSFIGLAALLWMAFLWNLGSIGLVDETEPLFAEAARQMTVTGDWITPMYNGETRFDKPPLVYWLMAIGYHIVGTNEWAVRLPSALSAIALTVFCFFTLRYFGFARATDARSLAEVQNRTIAPRTARQLWISAWLGAALTALNPETLVWARIGVSDMLLSGCMGCALLCFFWGYAQPERPARQWRWYFAGYVAIGLAILAKGPVGIVLPGLIIAVFLFYVGQLKTVWREVKPLQGCLIVAAITLPWYILVTWANGMEYINAFFGYHNFERFTSVVNRHSAPWYFYFLVVLGGFAPWSAYLPIAIARLRVWQRDRWQAQPRTAHFGVFAGVWFVTIFVFFSVSATKLPSYVLPLMPAAAILVGLLWSGELTRPARAELQSVNLESRFQIRWRRRLLFASGIFNLLLLLTLAGVSLYGAELIGYDPVAPSLPDVLRQSGLTMRTAAVWLAIAIATVIVLVRRKFSWLWVANLVGFLAFFPITAIPTFDLLDRLRQLPLRQLGEVAAEAQQPCSFANEIGQDSCAEIILIGFVKPSVVFYTQQPIKQYDEGDPAIEYFVETAGNPDLSQSVLIIMQTHKLKRLLREQQIPSHQYQILAERGAYSIMSIPRTAFAQSTATSQ